MTEVPPPPGDAGDPALAVAPAPGEIGRTRRRAVVTIAIGFTLLVITGALEGLIVWQSDRKLTVLQDAWLLHDATTEVLTELLKAESGQRGYLLLADPRYLEFYTLAEQKLPAAMARLQDLAAQVPGGTADFLPIAKTADAKRAELTATVALQRQGEHERALDIVRTGAGREYMDQFRADIAVLENISDRKWRQTSAALNRLAAGLMVAMAATVLAIIALAGVLIRDTNRQFHRLARRESTLRKLAAGLERRVAWRTRSLSEVNRRFDAALQASGVTVFTQDTDLAYTWISKPAFGFSQDAIIGHRDDELIGPKWRGPISELKRQVIGTGGTASAEMSVQEADIERWYSLTVGPQRGPDETICGIIGGAIDITDRKEHEARIHLLMRELTHRSRNLLSVVQAIARLSAANTASSEDFLERFGARLQSLAESHSLLVRDDWKGATMEEVVRSQLGQYSDLVGTRIELLGDPVYIGPDSAQHIGMALHELATNAAKHGALSSPEGKVRIQWNVAPDGIDGFRCRLCWQETDGPKVEPPNHRGFGRVVIERTTAQALDGKVTLSFAPSGFCWSLDFPRDYRANGRAIWSTTGSAGPA
jgi:PAS domain S-box-containing protein